MQREEYWIANPIFIFKNAEDCSFMSRTRPLVLRLQGFVEGDHLITTAKCKVPFQHLLEHGILHRLKNDILVSPKDLQQFEKQDLSSRDGISPTTVKRYAPFTDIRDYRLSAVRSIIVKARPVKLLPIQVFAGKAAEHRR